MYKLNFEYFIANRLVKSGSHKNTVSSPIIKIAILAIAISIAMMIISISTGIGLQQKIRQKIASFNGHIQISNYDENQSQVNVNPIDIRLLSKEQIKKNTTIENVFCTASKAGIIRTEKFTEGIIFKGLEADFDWKNYQEYLVEGHVPHFSKEDINQVLISKYLADRLELKVGSTFNTFFMKENGKLPAVRKFKVSGIYNSGFNDFDSSYLLGNIQHVQRINKWNQNQIGTYEVYLKDFEKLQESNQMLYKNIPPTFNSVSIQDRYYTIFEWLKLFDFNILVIIGLMIFVSVVNIVVALLVLILEKTQLIGLLKSMGASNWSIRKIFIYNASHLIIKGLIIGNVFAFVLLLLQKKFGLLKLPPENYYVNEAPVAFNWLPLIGVNFLTLTISIILLLVPSYLVSKIQPIKAIKFD